MDGTWPCLLTISLTTLLFCFSAGASPFFAEEIDYNLNQNESATDPLDFYGVWENHTYYPSPSNWRFPFYSFFLDRFVNGDPTNDNANDTVFEQDILSTQLRHGGDIAGVVQSLDYLQGMGIKGIYIAGSPFLNLPWTSDSYSPVDLTILDHHFGTINDWRDAIEAIHSRGMYIILDNTFATMGDLIGFDGNLNTSTPFTLKEHQVTWKTDRHYLDFTFNNVYNDSCQYPRFWNETGFPIEQSIREQMVGCYDSEFDQYGDTEAFGVFPDYQRQLSKFASVQDRLREWVPSVRDKIQHFSCIAIQMLDIDGFRFDKATQITVDAQGDFANYIRECASNVGKDNFFMPGEITGGNDFGSIYLGRGRQPDMIPPNASVAVALTTNSTDSYFIRDVGYNSLDAAAFHYTIYRSLTRFLGMSGNLEAGYDANGGSWTDTWGAFLVTNDLVNPNLGTLDPRHMYGTSNQDVFRWPAIENGTQRMLLGLFVTTIHLPGIPLLTWGEEQAFYVLDNLASNYIYGRQSMSSSPAWQLHGCYVVGTVQYYQWPLGAASQGCYDDSVALDHRDPSHPVRNVIKHMYFLREQYPVLNDGWYLQQLSNQTRRILYPGSGNTTTETGIWSVLRAEYPGVQDLSTASGKGNQTVWLVYHNVNETKTYQFNCSDPTGDDALISAFEENTTVKNLFYPFDELNLTASSVTVGFIPSNKQNGCVANLTLNPWEFKAYVPKDDFVAPPPMITRFLPGHDARVKSQAPPGGQEVVNIEIHFSSVMDCKDVTASIQINSTAEDLTVAQLNSSSVQCSSAPIGTEQPPFVAGIPTAWIWKAQLVNVSNGIHMVTVQNASASDGSVTNSLDHFWFRIGQPDNPIVFTDANYTLALIHQDPTNGSYWVSQKAAGADMWRYSLDFGSTWSNWTEYVGGNTSIQLLPWAGTQRQKWSGIHLMAQYWSKVAGSSSVIQHADLDVHTATRRFPHLFAHGQFNQFGYDAGLNDQLQLQSSGNWEFHFMSEWPDSFQLSVWGMDADGQPDETFVYGDVDGDMVLDRLPPSSLSDLQINFTSPPPSPYLAYTFSLNDGTFRYVLVPVGNRWQQLALFVLFALVPVITGFLAIWIYMKGFYAVKFNAIGIKEKASLLPLSLRRGRGMKKIRDEDDILTDLGGLSSAGALATNSEKRRCVLIATMEYDIEDWKIKIKIGGLGVMAQLMGKNLEHQDLIWVVPCVGGVDYPVDTPAPPMDVHILGAKYEVKIQYHKLHNITYVLLDAPVFRGQTKSEPYPPRMDDLNSAVYYSAWNQCIAETIKRFPVDLYHINDYHGTLGPLYLLPQTIPCCLSLHNAEFQGLWPMRTPKEREEVCELFNLSEKIVQQYVQFGSVFNLLHAGASYLRVHQKGFGAVGVSNKYGPRSWARYPIFWGLSKIGKLPNPDPSDTETWNKQRPKDGDVQVDPEFEAGRAELKRKAQEWAGLEQRTDAELFVFVGRWSNQKGVDLIADVFPAVLEQHPNVQLICVGPVIDLYGKFAALKLGKMMEKHPKRVFSRPEFTQLEPFIFSGAEFALIPSRDEPFGLVAVEFGRKGALGVGARVGGLGQMPGWWYTVESTTSAHLLKQFKGAIDSALASKTETRAMMRARSAKQRFPVQQWKEDLEILQTKSIKIHQKEMGKHKSSSRPSSSHSNHPPCPTSTYSTFSRPTSSYSTYTVNMFPLEGDVPPVPDLPLEWPLEGRSRSSSNASTTSRPVFDPSTSNKTAKPSGLRRQLSLGIRKGPGHRERPDVQRPDLDETDEDTSEDEDEYIMTQEEFQAAREAERRRAAQSSSNGFLTSPSPSRSHSRAPSMAPSLTPSMTPSVVESAYFDPQSLAPPTPFNLQLNTSRSSVLSIDSITKEKKDFQLQKVDPFFTDSNGEFYQVFEKRLESLNGKNSESELCIEEFLEKSERSWFDRFRDAKLGRTPVSSRPGSLGPNVFPDSPQAISDDFSQDQDEFLLGQDYKPPKGLKKYLSMKIGDWPVYTLFLAFGQIISANSYQVTLLTGTVGQSADKLYVVASIYLATSITWWILYRRIASVYVLSAPFAFYGLAFLLLGIAPFVSNGNSRFWVQNVATGFYATASSSGALFFSLNFGDEGGAPVKDWIIRACLIQGTQQLWVVALWYWGSSLAAATAASGVNNGYENFAQSPKVAAITLPIALCMWAIGIVIFVGLPDFYSQSPGKVPSFYLALFRRKIVTWTLVTVIIQNYFLSAPYGRNWQFLWSSRSAPAWAIVLLVLFFFVAAWALILWIFVRLSKSHSWILPIFAIGLGAPRFCQMWWSTSSIGLYLPWTGSAVASSLLSRSLWLWLGLLDTIQGVGFGMIFLQTLTRIHVAFTLIAAQVLGSVATILARATSPDATGPGTVFPDLSAGAINVLNKPWFWVALSLQLLICVGYFKFFRREQLNKP